ncbi:amidohydrolase family protein [Jiangella anatolica]|uniref:Amidohydrolase-related domain-containing protein n=1 Tax=Jiangella anatolica TaxID=2670374 RepID=A0A2W2B9Y4_9ACTN|nr:hypothetical protein [Jiangella anatolica]PZF82932.1 hypothetical protein C1I92_14845 [Jiangella anatolica]
MRIFDAHRLLGPVPGDDVPSADVAGLLAELDHLGVDGAAVTPSEGLYGDPAYQQPAPAADERLVSVPVILPAVAGAGWPDDPGVVVAHAPAMVRACPVRHRFALTGPVALRWWHELAAARIPVALDAGETGLDRVHALAAAVPGLRILVLSPGYRSLRELAELVAEHPGVHVETGTLVAAGAIEWLARQAGAHRLVFGTGAPVWDDAGPRFQLDHLRLPAADVELIAAGSFDALTARVTT